MQASSLTFPLSVTNDRILLAKWSGWLEVDTYAGSCPGWRRKCGHYEEAIPTSPNRNAMHQPLLSPNSDFANSIRPDTVGEMVGLAGSRYLCGKLSWMATQM